MVSLFVLVVHSACAGWTTSTSSFLDVCRPSSFSRGRFAQSLPCSSAPSFPILFPLTPPTKATPTTNHSSSASTSKQTTPGGPGGKKLQNTQESECFAPLLYYSPDARSGVRNNPWVRRLYTTSFQSNTTKPLAIGRPRSSIISIESHLKLVVPGCCKVQITWKTGLFPGTMFFVMGTIAAANQRNPRNNTEPSHAKHQEERCVSQDRGRAKPPPLTETTTSPPVRYRDGVDSPSFRHAGRANWFWSVC